MYSFTSKYAPKNIKEIVGQKLAISKLMNFLESSRKKFAVVYGPPGVGKTCSVRLIVKDMGYEVVEINIDDLLEKENLHYTLNNVISTGSLFGRKKVVIIDGIESLNARILPKMVELIKKSKVPIVAIAIDLWDPKLKLLRPYSEGIEFKKHTAMDIEKKLKYILEFENIAYENEAIKILAKSAEGDMRAAINDLEVSVAGKTKLTAEDLLIGERDIRKNIFSALQRIFKSNFSQKILDIFDTLNIDLNTGILWISENICNEYTAKDSAVAYNFISRSDVFLGRIRKRQYWGLYKYSKILLTAGINLSKTKIKLSYVKYNFPTRLLKLSKTKKTRGALKSIAKKIAPILHISSKVLFDDYSVVFKIILKVNSKVKKDFAKKFDLSKGEMEILAK